MCEAKRTSIGGDTPCATSFCLCARNGAARSRFKNVNLLSPPYHGSGPLTRQPSFSNSNKLSKRPAHECCCASLPSRGSAIVVGVPAIARFPPSLRETLTDIAAGGETTGLKAGICPTARRNARGILLHAPLSPLISGNVNYIHIFREQLQFRVAITAVS